MTRRIVINCWPRWKRHKWAVVPGVMSTSEAPYTERRCVQCHMYESEVR
jgi:hypothetical protein